MNNTLSEKHQDLYRLLKEFKKVCDENDIWYSLAYGSVLGAVRHKGFIPWDQDADVYLKLPDKERFREAFKRSDHGDIMLRDCEATPKCLQSHDSLYLRDKDVHLDIYLLVGAPSEPKEQNKFTKFSSFADRVIRSKYVDIRKCKKKNKPLVFVAKMIDYCFPDKVLRRSIDNRENKYPYENAKFITDLGCEVGSRGCLPREIFDEVIEMDFETETFKVLKMYERYLIAMYGTDYMTPKVY